jgi:hypothetical protein
LYRPKENVWLEERLSALSTCREITTGSKKVEVTKGSVKPVV